MASDVSCFWWSECYFLSSSYLVVWNLSISHKLDIDTWDYFQCSVFKVPYNLLRKLLREIAARFSVFLPKRFATLGFFNRNRFISIPWRQRDSNSRPPACKAGALPTELCPLTGNYAIVGALFWLSLSASGFHPMGLSGLEPPTSRLSGVRSNQLSYKPIRFLWLLMDSGSHLLSHTVSSIVPSAA